MKNRKYPINEGFFDNIDSPLKAYFLGLLYADGCNSTEINLIRLVLSEKDKAILEKLSSLIYINYKPLDFRKGTYFTDNGKTYLRKNSFQFRVTSKHISKKLEEHGLVKAKSLILTFPMWLDLSLISHFIRGYFDGDGSLSLSDKQLQISILGTETFCQHLQNIFHELLIKSSICQAKRNSPVKQICIHGNQGGRKFLEWIYKDSTTHLDRKYQKYLNFCKIIPPIKLHKCLLCEDKKYCKSYCKKHYYALIGKKLRHERYIKSKLNLENL